LVIPAAESNIASQLRLVAGSGPPIVFLDRRPPDWDGDVIMVANEPGAYRATRYLLQMGHRRLAAITGPMHLTNAVERLKGFKRALSEAKVAIEPEYIQEARFNRNSGYEAAMRLLKMLPRPTAIFACNDLMALGVLLAARESSLRCPEDLSIVGFDNLDLTEFTAPALTSVHQPGYQMGTTAARLLLERIDGLKLQPKKVVLPTELKIRGSVAPPPLSASSAPRRKPRRSEALVVR
jgi:LacI family transcriptional regulator